ncbi:hypothetical protein ACH5RR_027504 [Cinchona calisaya]|uniref:Uncharacterized protein n=1 Tax=Cinchona calisaya TaxID=153742 RepID=A0ABD2Z9J1_9GENT
MEAIMFQYTSQDHQPISPYKSHIKKSTPKRPSNLPPFISSQTSQNFASTTSTTGLLQAPPSQAYQCLSHSYPTFSFQHQQPPPPILHLPISATTAKRKTTSSLTPKKSKTTPKNEENLKPLGPAEPKDLPKNVPKILTLLSGNNSNINNVVSTNDVSCFDAIKDHQVDEFSGSVAFSGISPPPSSLPLPTFSLRPKLSCNAEAAGIDAGATDNLRRLLRLP